MPRRMVFEVGNQVHSDRYMMASVILANPNYRFATRDELRTHARLMDRLESIGQAVNMPQPGEPAFRLPADEPNSGGSRSVELPDAEWNLLKKMSDPAGGAPWLALTSRKSIDYLDWLDGLPESTTG